MNRYAKSLLYAGLVSCVLGLAAAPSFAQTANSNSSSNAGAASQSSSGAAARSGNSDNRQSITFNSPGETTSRNTNTNTNNSNQTGGFNNRDQINYSGGTSNSNYNSGDQTIRTTPTVYAPPVSGGNPCTLAVSGGVSVIGWGAAAGGTFVDEACATRQKIAMIHNAGYAGAAKELMCDDKATYFAFRTAGTPCAFRPAFEGTPAQPPVAPQPMVQQQPTPIAPTVAPRAATIAPKQYVRCAPPRIVDNCVSG